MQVIYPRNFLMLPYEDLLVSQKRLTLLHRSVHAALSSVYLKDVIKSNMELTIHGYLVCSLCNKL